MSMTIMTTKIYNYYKTCVIKSFAPFPGQRKLGRCGAINASIENTERFRSSFNEI